MRRLSYLVSVVLLCSFLAIHTFSLPAFALTTYTLKARSLQPQEWSDFSVVWTEDTNGDQLFQLGEEKEFSGVTFLPIANFYQKIGAVPVKSAASPYTGGTADKWTFTDNTGSTSSGGLAPSLWEYTRVPIPASALLLGSGLLSLGFLSWRRRRS